MDFPEARGGAVSADERVPVLFGPALSFADDLRAPDILPTRFASLAPAEAARHLFADLDAGLAARIEPGSVLVAGHGLGRGEGSAPAAQALAAAGFVVIVAASYADAFDEHCLAARLAPLEVDAPNVFHTGQRVRVNCEAGAIANLSSGDRQPIRNLTEAMLERLRAALGR